MEPCAPGTEDDPPIMYSTLNKQIERENNTLGSLLANEQERILKQKAILKNGKYDNVFELSYVNGAEHWFCHICECPVMGRIYQHELGKRHSTNFQASNRHVETRRREKTPEEPLTLDIAPGEPLPPGFEGEIDRVAQIQERLDGFKVGPLIALEYLLELQDYDPAKEPYYLCILCDKRGDPRTVLTHLASYNHISQYLQKHFPTCYRALAPYMTKQYKRNWQTTLQKIAEAIEKKFGRLKPLPIEKDKFEKDRLFYLQMVSKGRHFSEMSGWTFEEIIVHDELTKTYEDEKPHESSANNNWGGSAYIQKPFKKRSPSPPVVACPSKKNKGNAQTNPKKQPTAFTMGSQSSTNPAVSSQNPTRRRSLSSVSSISSSDLSDNEDKNATAVKDTKPRAPPFQRGRQLPYERNRSPSPRRRPMPTVKKAERGLPWQSQGYQKQKNEFEEKRMTEKEKEKIRKLEEYRKLARAIENDMHKTLKQHEKNPEKHPQYNDEWKKFWNKRYKELQAQRIDASKYDFKPEWIEFWNKKMLELHNTELQNRKEGLRKRLGLPEEPTAIKFKIATPQARKSTPEKNKPNLPMAAQPDQDNEVIVIDDKDEDTKSQNRSHSPWEKEANTRGPVDRSQSHTKGPIERNRAPKRSPSKEWSRERSPQRKMERPRKSQTKETFPSKRSHSRDRSRSIDRSREFRETHSRDRRSRSRDRRSRSRDRRSRSRSWERSREHEKRVEYHRESSYERDLRAKDRIRTVADLPWEREKMVYRQYEDYYKPPPIMRDVTRKPMLISESSMPPEADDDGEVNIVDVLRILTALEERLGSLGPKVIDLLAQALAMEKKEANSSEKLLDNDINCVLFETVKEKLKGQLLAGLVDLMQERAFKKAIKKTATLLHMASERKEKRDRMMPKVKEVTVPGVGTVDRVAIAKQIANALILQGKTDVTQAELEELINAVVGMAEASKNSDKPVTTANFLQKLASGSIPFEEKKQEKEEKEPEEKIIIPTSFKKTEVVELEKLTEPLTPSPGKNSVNNMENLSDSDLQTLLQNFKDLSTDEQHNLINYLKKLETQEPERVERLRKFVSLDPSAKLKEEKADSKSDNRCESPFSNRLAGGNPMVEDMGKVDSEEDEGCDKDERKTEEKERKVHLDSEDEDYTFEDVVKAVKDKELKNDMKIVEESMKFETNKTKSDVDLSDAKALISNLMSNFSKSSSASNTIDMLGLGGGMKQPVSSSSLLTSTADFAKTLSDINVASLASIVSSVKNLSPIKSLDKPLNFQPPSPLRSNAGKLNFNPPQLNRLGPEPQGNMLGRPNIGLGGSAGPRMGLGGMGPPRGGPPGMGPGGSSLGQGLGLPGMGTQNMGRPDMGPGPKGPTGLRPLMGSVGHGFNGPDSLSRDDRGPFGGPSFEPDRFSESNFGGRDRPPVQYPRSTPSYGNPSNFGNNNYPQQQNVQYPNIRGGPRPGGFEQRDRFDRFGSGPNNRPGGGGGFNRW